MFPSSSRAGTKKRLAAVLSQAAPLPLAADGEMQAFPSRQKGLAPRSVKTCSRKENDKNLPEGKPAENPRPRTGQKGSRETLHRSSICTGTVTAGSRGKVKRDPPPKGRVLPLYLDDQVRVMRSAPLSGACTFSKTMWPSSSAVTRTVQPGSISLASILSERGSSTSRWMALRKGRAP